MITTNVLIGIQARSTSERLPRKSFATIGGTTLVDHMITIAQSAVQFLDTKDSGMKIMVALLIPEGDEILERLKPTCLVVQGSEKNVLSRFVRASELYRPNYIVRLTADCPLLPPYIISNHIKTAVKNNLDYLSNCDPRFRTSPDGHDVEVISSRLLDWVADNADSDFDREHVTPLIRKNPPAWAKIANSIGFVDLSHVKISVDTEEDLERVQKMHQEIEDKISSAILNQKNFRKIFRL